LYSCKEDNPVIVPPKVYEYPSDIYLDRDVWLPGPMTGGFVQAKKNGLDWKASAEGSMYNFQGKVWAGFCAFAYNSKGNPRDQICVYNIPFIGTKFKPFTKGNDKLNYLQTTFGRSAGTGNSLAILPYLIVDTTAVTNYFDIITMDSVTNTLEARFDVSLINSSKQLIASQNGIKEKMRFSEGYLKITIKRQ
jgi:hypothetical protein